MELSELALLAVAALGAGAINGAVGSGSLITLPVLLSLGLPPATALMTNTVGILFSGVGGTMAYRTELLAERREIAPLAGSAGGRALTDAVSPDSSARFAGTWAGVGAAPRSSRALRRASVAR